MPREKITSTTTFTAEDDPTAVPEGARVANTRTLDLAIGWNRHGRWVQLHVIPKGWQDTGEWTSFDLDPEEIDHLVRTLRRAKKNAYTTAE